jgi:hypothetical protein
MYPFQQVSIGHTRFEHLDLTIPIGDEGEQKQTFRIVSFIAAVLSNHHGQYNNVLLNAVLWRKVVVWDVLSS